MKSTLGCLVWLPVERRTLAREGHQMPCLVVGDKHPRAIKTVIQGQPVLFSLTDSLKITGVLALVDGAMLTGSPSNLHSSRYNNVMADSDLSLDATLCMHRASPDSGGACERWRGRPTDGWRHFR